MKEYKQTWNLAPLLEGRGHSYTAIESYLDDLAKEMDHFSIDQADPFTPLGDLQNKLSEAGSLMACLTGVNTEDTEACRLDSKLSSLLATFETINLQVDQKLMTLSDEMFNALVKRFSAIAFALEERRSLAKEKMSLPLESLATELSVSGHSAYSTLYFTYMGAQRFPFQGEELSLGKLENHFSDADRASRQESISSLETVLSKGDIMFSHILNNILDFRLRLYKQRGWKSFTHASLRQNRMEQKTLDTMWDVVSQNKGNLKKYMDRKAKLLGLPKLSWCDTEAPLGDAKSAHIPWDKGIDKMLSLFSKISPKITDFTKRALQNGFVDAAPSQTKRAGGFCTSAPLLKESRILMTYMDSSGSLSTLAHELGHAFHSQVLFDLPPFLQNYPMNVAETASTLFEMIVADGALQEAPTKEEKIILLDDKISRYLAFGMDIHSRYLFDTAIHKRRSCGFIPPEELNHLMVEAQKEGFDHGLSDYLPHFWCYKMHFYFTDVTFYNWPYAFGYLFSLGLYTTLIDDPHFENRYIAFLRDTGSMHIEDLAKKHLGVDLTKGDFWQKGIDVLNKDIELFLSLTDK